MRFWVMDYTTRDRGNHPTNGMRFLWYALPSLRNAPHFHLYEGEAGDYTVKDPGGRLFQLRNLLEAMGFVRRQSGGEEVMVSCFSEGGGLVFEKLIGEEVGRFRLSSVAGAEAE